MFSAMPDALRRHRRKPMHAADDLAEILTLLERQAMAWNRGDLDAFMEGYWPHPQLRYANGNPPVRGWTALYQSYRERYGQNRLEGRLTFGDVEVEFLGDEHAMVFGSYAVDTGADHAHGNYTLILRRLPVGWRIVADQSSAAH